MKVAVIDCTIRYTLGFACAGSRPLASSQIITYKALMPSCFIFAISHLSGDFGLSVVSRLCLLAHFIGGNRNGLVRRGYASTLLVVCLFTSQHFFSIRVAYILASASPLLSRFSLAKISHSHLFYFQPFLLSRLKRKTTPCFAPQNYSCTNMPRKILHPSRTRFDTP